MNRPDIQQIRQQVLAQPTVQQALNWYQALAPRDRLIVKAVAGLAAIALVFVLVYAPLLRSHQQLEQDLARKLDTWELIAGNAHRFGDAAADAPDTGAPVLPRVSQSARQAGIKLDRFEQDGKDVRIWIDRVSFDAFIAWVEQLQAREGIVVSQITIDSTNGPGWVNVRATLSPG
ncbi:type II secretion system protein M [Parathalassolituus penaei]|uniref:Type II secretion system protein M n=1 Tax=Parathalassolituus penaei TaxID=2997323 RepID=A0A9X3EE17_9GAMM|nr:type II secretion system protein M [Parathalassolituus penaei]MCY0965490.1 type II secretion system protein M [Parathalassolituus penaei]